MWPHLLRLFTLWRTWQVKHSSSAPKQGANCQGGLRGSEGPSSETSTSAISCHLLQQFLCIPSGGHHWVRARTRGKWGWWWWRCDNFTQPKGLSAVKENQEMLAWWSAVLCDHGNKGGLEEQQEWGPGEEEVGRWLHLSLRTAKQAPCHSITLDGLLHLLQWVTGQI